MELISPLLTSEFDYNLPDRLIAQRPVEPRDSARLLVLDRASAGIAHRTFADLPELLNPGDLLVRNDTRVVPARLFGVRETTGGKWEGLFLREVADGGWEILSKTRGRIRPGERVLVGSGLALEFVEIRSDGGRIVRPISNGESTTELLIKYGHVPIPPYIRGGIDDPSDRLRYQTVYAQTPGAVAAPTAGLHFTEELFNRLGERGIQTIDVTLHVGIGTFRPIETERIDEHNLHAEWAEVSRAAASKLNETRARGGRVIAIGTTSTRTLETSARNGTGFEPFSGETALYIKPGHVFRGVDALVTNFHLPKSSLLVLVSALAGIENVKRAYAEAIRLEYRFYSYGDAMLIL